MSKDIEKEIKEEALLYASNDAAIIERGEKVHTVDTHLGNPQLYETKYVMNTEAKLGYTVGAREFYSRAWNDAMDVLDKKGHGHALYDLNAEAKRLGVKIGG